MKKQQGFTLLELLISLSIGAFVIAGILSIFVSMRSTTSQTSSFGEMQETGRFAINTLTEDLMRQGFWGDLSVELSLSNLQSVTADPTVECDGAGVNNGSFPSNNANFRSLWGVTTTNATPINCITDAVVGSDVLQVKRVIANEVAVANVDSATYYLVTDNTLGQIVAGGIANPPIEDSRIWEYQHHIYYVSNETQNDNTIPVLNLISLASGSQLAMVSQPLIEGVERIHFHYGVDTDGDQIVNNYLTAANVTDDMWDQAGENRIISMKMFILVREVMPDTQYVNSNTYTLGDIEFTPAEGDNYRRMLFTSTVTLHNGDDRQY